MTTNCLFPPELDDWQMLAYLDNPAANPETANHLEKCPYCREKSEALDRVQKRLTTQLYRVNCPSPTELGEYHFHLLPASQMLMLAQHVRECPYCAREVAQLEGFLQELEPPPGSRSFFENAKVLVARLVGGNAESGQTGFSPAVPALRGAATDPLTFEADGIVIVLDMQPDNDEKVNILGQVAAEDQETWTGALVELQQANKPPFSTTMDDLGAFRYESIMPGSADLRIVASNGTIIAVPAFEVSA